MQLRAAEDPNDGSRPSEAGGDGNSTLLYDVLLFALVAVGAFFTFQSIYAADGAASSQSSTFAIGCLGLAGVVGAVRPYPEIEIGSKSEKKAVTQKPAAPRPGDSPADPVPAVPSLASLTAAEWRERYEKKDKTISLWTEDSFSTPERFSGSGTGEGKSKGGVPVHNVKMTDRQGTVWDLQVPEDRYILWEAEDQGLQLPFACRAGCCTTCAVRIDKGVMVQDQALGIAAEYREQGYGLMCVGYPKSDLVMELVEEDELYDKQFGWYFDKNATNPTAPTVKRDDFALEIAMGDE